MNSEVYFSQIRYLKKLSPEAIRLFVESFSNAHSWYKHLSDERNGTFFFYFLPNTNEKVNQLNMEFIWSNSLLKSWDEEFKNEEERDESMLQNIMSEYSIPREALEFGKIKLSRYIHYSFSTATEYFVESPERKSFAELHKDITNELFDHLNKLSNFIYSQ